jgi:hypothetical protein
LLERRSTHLRLVCLDLTDKLAPDTNVDPAVGTSIPYLD